MEINQKLMEIKRRIGMPVGEIDSKIEAKIPVKAQEFKARAMKYAAKSSASGAIPSLNEESKEMPSATK